MKQAKEVVVVTGKDNELVVGKAGGCHPRKDTMLRNGCCDEEAWQRGECGPHFRPASLVLPPSAYCAA